MMRSQYALHSRDKLWNMGERKEKADPSLRLFTPRMKLVGPKRAPFKRQIVEYGSTKRATRYGEGTMLACRAISCHWPCCCFFQTAVKRSC